jgi:type II secretory pathway component PulM
MMQYAAIDAWRSRPARERWLLGLPAVALLAVVLYVAAWEPLHESILRLRGTLPELEARRESIRAQAAELRAQPGPAAAPGFNAALVQAALERRQLRGALPALEPAGENRNRLAFARVPFDAIWPLLQDLQMDHGIRIVSLRVDRLDGGNVRLEAVLGAGDR